MRISTRTFPLFTACLLAAAFAGAGCSSSSSSGTNLTTVCNQYCAKCNNASAGVATVAICANCSAFSSSMSTCKNETEIAAAAQSCANMSSCSASETCFETNIPDCQTSGATGGSSGTGTGGHASTGTGGSTGSGGSSANGGSSGSADCSACDKFVSSGCCAALLTMEGQSSSNCATLTSACSSGPSSVAPTCQQGMTAGTALNIAACK